MSYFQLLIRRFSEHQLAFYSSFILLFLILSSLCAHMTESWLQVSHEMASLDQVLLPMGWPHLLGTNDVGQDLFTRLLYGGRISLSVGIIAAVASAIIGSTIGLISGYFGGVLDTLLMRFTDSMLSIPVLPLMIVFSAIDLERISIHNQGLGWFFLALSIMGITAFLRFISSPKTPWRFFFSALIVDFLMVILGIFMLYISAFIISYFTTENNNLMSVIKLILIIVFFGWMTVARLTRASAMQVKNMDYVLAARALGASHLRILITHILPNCTAPIIVAATLEVGSNILYEAALSFLGLGVQPPVSSWGNMLNSAVDYIKVSPMLAFYPGFMILITVACFNFFGDGLRDALDPRKIMKQ